MSNLAQHLNKSQPARLKPRDSRQLTQDVKRAADGKWPFVFTSLGIPAEYLDGRNHPCPACGGKDRFQLTTKGHAARWGRFNCRAHHDGGGDGLKLVIHYLGCTFPQAVEAVARVLGMSEGVPKQHERAEIARPSVVNPHVRGAEPRDSTAKVQAIWGKGKPLTGDCVASRYLASRGLGSFAGRYPDSLRCVPDLAYFVVV